MSSCEATDAIEAKLKALVLDVAPELEYHLDRSTRLSGHFDELDVIELTMRIEQDFDIFMDPGESAGLNLSGLLFSDLLELVCQKTAS